MKTNIATLGYSGFCTLLSEDTEDRFRVILDYDDFQVWEDTETHGYYYLERDENDASDFFEVVLVAVLTYSSIHDINEKNGERLSELFDCCCCGECVSDDKIEYLWFEQREFTLTEKGNIK